MNTATAVPMKPSSSSPVKCAISVAMSTAEVEITSLRLSSAVAISAPDSIFLPMPRLKRAIQSLTAMDMSSTITVAQLNTTPVGCRIFSTLLLSSSTPMTRIITATIRPERYS